MTFKSKIISFILGCLIAILLFNTRELYMNGMKLSTENNKQKEEVITLNSNITRLVSENQVLSNQLIEAKITTTQTKLDLIEPFKQSDKRTYIQVYDSIMTNVDSPPETIYDYTTDEEFDMICRVIEAESGICDFNGKVNVATVIINRYNTSTSNETWIDILTKPKQFTTVLNGSYKRVEVSDDTKLALEYAWLFKSPEVGDATYFRSQMDNSWHDKANTLEFVYFDGKHFFYREIK